MWEGMLARMIARALPPHIADSDQERIAAEAAENAIRQTARFAGIAGVLLLVLAGAMLFRYLPIQQNSQGRSEPSKAASEPGAEESRLRQENEELQKKLDDVTKVFQGKVTALEGQVADLTTKLHAAENLTASEQKRARATQETAQSLTHVPGSGRTRVAAAPPSVYQCGDGRTAPDPAGCQNTASPNAPAVSAAPPSVYQCGDGRTAPDPAGCMNMATPSGG